MILLVIEEKNNKYLYYKCFVMLIMPSDIPPAHLLPLWLLGQGGDHVPQAGQQVTRQWNTFSYEIYEEEKRKKKILLYEDVPPWRVCTWRGRGWSWLPPWGGPPWRPCSPHARWGGEFSYCVGVCFGDYFFKLLLCFVFRESFKHPSIVITFNVVT